MTTTPRIDGTSLERAHFRIRALREALSDICVLDASQHPESAAKIAELSLRVDDSRAQFAEDNCPGHVASEDDRKVCGRCGVHINSFRPDDARAQTGERE